MKNILLPAFAIIALSLIIACGGKNEKVETTTSTDNLMTVKSALVLRESVNDPILASGIVSSESEARPAFKTGGVIERTLVEEGAQVQAGQLLATLNLSEISAQVQQAQLALQKAERDLGRVRNLQKDSVATLEQLQNATTGVDIAKQTLAIAEFNKSYSEVRSPISGKVIKKIMNAGEIVGPGNPIYYILSNNTNDFVVKCGLADRDWARLKGGDRANIRLDAYPGEQFEAHISRLADVGNPTSGTFDAELKISTKGKKLATGLIAAVEMFPQASGAKAIIPIEALLEANGSQGFVMAADGQGIARKLPVTIAFLKGSQVVLASGLDGVTEVLTNGVQYVKEGQKVKVVR